MLIGPQGDLTELLGSVPPYTPRLPLNDPHAFPYLPEDGEHPYHLVVVCVCASFAFPRRRPKSLLYFCCCTYIVRVRNARLCLASR
jgi:hypothetical protein